MGIEEEGLTAAEEGRLTKEELAILKAEDDGEELTGSATGEKIVDDDDDDGGLDTDGIVAEDLSGAEEDKQDKQDQQKAEGVDKSSDKSDDEDSPIYAEAAAKASLQADSDTGEVQPIFSDVEPGEDESAGIPSNIFFRQYTPRVDITAKQAEIDTLQNQFDDGDIEEKEYRQKVRSIERDINTELSEQNSVVRHNEDLQKHILESWKSAQKRFYNVPKNQRFIKDDILYAAHVQACQELGPKMQGASFSKILNEAKKRVVQSFGISTSEKVQSPPKKADVPPKPLKKEIPQTLHDIPGAAPVDTSKFSALNAAMRQGKPEEIERIAKGLSEADMDRWLLGN